MGRTDTDVAREAVVMVLLDDSFASIAAAVRLGRSVYADIRKFLIYLFSHNVGELVPILAVTFAGFPPVPLSAVQILAIDLGSDVLPALALGAERPEPGVMDSPPRRPSQRLFSAALSANASSASAASWPASTTPTTPGSSTADGGSTSPCPPPHHWCRSSRKQGA